MEAAQQVHGIGIVTAGMAAGRFEQGIEIGMASATLARNARKLCFGNADRLVADGPINRHSSPLVLNSGEAY